MTADGPSQHTYYRRRRRLAGIRLSAFIVVAIVGLVIAAIPLEAAAEVSWNGGPTSYCKAENALPSHMRGNPRIGMIQCSGNKPDYVPDIPLYVIGGLIAAAGLIGAFAHGVELLEIRRSSHRPA